ncbi:hypothetical protein INR49_009721, partial [Caranx melampygus]
MTQRDDRALLTEASTSQQTLSSQPVVPDIPVITGVEESQSAAGDQEDKEELEFPHDLLPSLDFSSELNIWESSLGAHTSSGERKSEQVNPLLVGLQHHMDVGRPLVVLETRPHDSDPLLTDARPSPQPTATPYPSGRPLTPTPLGLLDKELQEAFQECEEQMASLGMLPPTEHHSNTHEVVHDVGKKTGDVMVNKPNESLSLPPVVVQPGHSNGGPGNRSTHGNNLNPFASADQRSDAQTQEAIVTTEAAIQTQENQSPLTNSQTCVGESCVESAPEEALVVVAVLPLTTPTMPEVMESNGEGESVRCDSLKRVATVETEESEETAGEKDLGGIDERLSSADGEGEGILDSPPQLSLICSQGKCSLAFSAKEGQATSEKSCSSKMPHNSVEDEMKGQRDTSVHSVNAETPPAEEGDREKEPLRRRGRGGGGEGGGEEVGEKGRLAREHSSFSQPEGSVSGVSSAETETCPPTDVAESQLKSQSWREPIATITESICTEQDRLSHPCQEQHGAAISPLPIHPEQSSSNTNAGVRADLKQNLISEEALSSGHACEESSITETEENYSQDLDSLIKPQPLTTSQQIPVERQTSNNQQVQPESSTTEARTAESAAEIQVQAQGQSNSGSPTMSGVGVYVSANRGGSNRVHFADTVKQDSTSTVALRNKSVSAMDCASLPPLTVHESLHHPVEESFIFPDFLGVKKPEVPINTAPSKDEPAKQSSADFPKPQKDGQLDKGGLETKSIAVDQSGNNILVTNTVDLQLATKACMKQLPSPAEKNETGNKECFDLSQTAGSAVSNADHATVEQVSVKVLKQEEGKTEKSPINLDLSKEKELNKFCAESTDSVKSEQPQESPLISAVPEEKEGNQQPLSSCPELPADDVTCKPLNDVTELSAGQLSGVDLSLTPEAINLTCTASLQMNTSDPTYQLPTQSDQTPACGLVISDLMKATEGAKPTIHSAEQTKDESVTSEVTASDQSIPVIEQCATNPTFVLQPPGPMLSHLEFITDSDICPPEQTDKRCADGDSTKVSGELDGNKSGKKTQMSSAQDLTHTNVSVSADEADPKPEDRNYAEMSVTEFEESAIKNENVPFSQEENLSPLVKLPATLDVTDNVISLSQTEPDSIAIKPVVCETSIRDGLINESCPLSSDLPSNDDETKKDYMTEKQKMGDGQNGQTWMQFEEDKKQSGEATMDNDKKTAISSKLQTGKGGTTPQQSDEPDKEVAGEFRDNLQPPHEHKVEKSESPVRDITEEGERNSEIASKSETETSSLSSPTRPAGSSEDTVRTEVESGSEPHTVYDPSLSQTPTATLERSTDSNTAQDLNAALSQSQSASDPNYFAQQQEQQQQECLGSRHPTEELSGGCLKGVEETQALLPGVKGVAEEGDGSIGSLCQRESRDELTCDDSGGRAGVIGLEREDREGAGAVKGLTRFMCLPAAVLSKCPEDLASLEKPNDQVSLSKPVDVIVVKPIVAASQSEGKPLDEAPARMSPVQGPSANAEAADVLDSPAPKPTPQEPETNWIKALKEAASQSQGEQVQTAETLRPLPSLESPQLEFHTPTEEIAAPLTQEEIPPPEQAAEKTTEIPPLVKKPVDLPEPLKKSADLPEPTQQVVELSEPTQSTREELSEPTKKEEEPSGELPEPEGES